MFRLICNNNFFIFTTTPASFSKYIIKKGTFLIPAPPKRPSNSYALYVKQEFAKDKNLKVKTAAADLAKKWKLYPEIKAGFDKEKEKAGGSQEYEKIKAQYKKNFILPFKRLSGHNLRLKQLFTDKKIQFVKGQGIKGVGEQITKALQETRTLESDTKLKEQAKKINEEKQLLIKKFEFPQPEYKSFGSYRLKHSLPKEKRGDTYDEDLKIGYNATIQAWEGKVAKWLEENKYQIKIEEFLKLYKKSLEAKKTKKSAANDDSEESD